MAPPLASTDLFSWASCDAVAERPLGRALQLDVEREADGVARLRVAARLDGALRAAERVDADLRRARPCRAGTRRRWPRRRPCRSCRPRYVVAPSLLLALQLGRGDLADVAEHLRGERLVRVVAQVGLLDLDARELRLVLEQVVDLVVVHRRLTVIGVSGRAARVDLAAQGAAPGRRARRASRWIIA